MAKTHRTGTWTTIFADAGDVIDVRSLDPEASLPGGDEHRAKVIRRVNEDMHAGIAPAIERWGVEYREELAKGDAFYWISYLSLTWHSLYDGTPEAERREKVARLDGLLDDMIALGDAGRNRVRTHAP